MSKAPQLTFFCELEAKPLKCLFENRFVYDDLKALGAGVSLGILDFSPERVRVVRQLNHLKIPVTAWLLLQKDQGYWFNLQNHAQAAAIYGEFLEWTNKNALEWHAIGVDIETDFNEMNEGFHKPTQLVRHGLRRLRNDQAYREGKQAYSQLIARIRADGWQVESYQFPMIQDDRLANSTVLQKAAGLVDLAVDREVLMLYTSIFGKLTRAMIEVYGAQAGGVGIGNTGGGVVMEGVPAHTPLTWEQFTGDLRAARQTGKPVYVFCLEGCVAQGFLPRLTTFEWNDRQKIPGKGLVRAGRGGLQGLLWLIQRPLVGAAALAGVIGGVLILRRGKK